MARRTADEMTTRRLENLLGRQEVTARRLADLFARLEEAAQLLAQAHRPPEPRPRHLRLVREAADGV